MQRFSAKKGKALTLLLGASSVAQVARELKVSESTVYRWLEEQEFRERYQKAKRELLHLAINRLQSIALEAVTTLREIMIDAEKPPSSRVTAARAILETVFRSFELEDLEGRIEKLEATQKK